MKNSVNPFHSNNDDTQQDISNYAAKAKALFYRYSVVVASTCSTDQYFSPRVYVFIALFTCFFVLINEFIYFSGICTSKTTSSNKHCGHLLTGTLQPLKLELSRELQYAGEYFFAFTHAQQLRSGSTTSISRQNVCALH